MQNLLKFLNRISNHVTVLNAGAKLFEGTLKDTSADPRSLPLFLEAEIAAPGAERNRIRLRSGSISDRKQSRISCPLR